MNPFEGKSIPRTIFQYAVPTILSQIVTLLYNLADTFFVGHTNDPSQVAALTLSFPLFMTLTMVGNLFGIGANSLISRSLGKKDRETAGKAAAFAIFGGLIFMLLWIVILFALLPVILPAIGAVTDATYEATQSYLTWTILIGGLPTVAALLIAHCIRGEGNTRQAGIGVAIGGLLNIGLDPVFVQGLGMGVTGAGMATCISNCLSLLWFLIILKRSERTVISLRPRRSCFVPGIMREVLVVGLPAAMVIVLGSSANIVLTHCMSAYGDVSVAAFGVVQKIGTVTMQITIGLTQGIMPLLGFCYGAGDKIRVRQINRWSFLILAVFSGGCVLLLELLPETAIRLFTGEAATVATGTEFLRIWILCVFGMCFVFLFNCIYQAMGKWLRSLILSVIRQGVLLIPILLLFDRAWGAMGLMMSQPVADTIALLVAVLMYRALLRKEF